TADEVRALLVALDDEPGDLRAFMRLRFLTATRGGELLAVKHEHVDLDAQVLTIPAEIAKAGKAHRVPLVDEAVAILKARQESATSPYLFPAAKVSSTSGHRVGLQDFYKRLRVKSGVQFTGHDLRRWWSSTAASLEVPHEIISHALGHTIPT